MAGSFGYEAEHLSMSRAIAEVLYEQVDGQRGRARGRARASCRTQLGEREDGEPPHPVEMIAEALSD